MEQSVAEKRRGLVSEWVVLQLDRRARRAGTLPLEEFLVAGGVPRLHLASLDGQLKDEELLERFVQYALARVFPGGKLNTHALTEWDLVHELGPYPRLQAPSTDEVHCILERRMRKWLELKRARTH